MTGPDVEELIDQWNTKKPMPTRRFGYFNADNYYSFELSEKGVTVFSECCGDTLDLEGAFELYCMLGEWLYDNQNR